MNRPPGDNGSARTDSAMVVIYLVVQAWAMLSWIR